ncbi:hypothetical protein RQP46_009019 [Phenoliferia psychrophenolica]
MAVVVPAVAASTAQSSAASRRGVPRATASTGPSSSPSAPGPPPPHSRDRTTSNSTLSTPLINSRQATGARLSSAADVDDFFGVTSTQSHLGGTTPPARSIGRRDGKGKTRRRRPTREGGGLAQDGGGDEQDASFALSAKYDLDQPTSPILPRVKLHFPSLESDSDDEPRERERVERDRDHERQRQKSWSQTTTTTTTRRTERRTWRNSMPSGSTLPPPPEHQGQPHSTSNYASRATPLAGSSSRPPIPFPRATPTASSSSSAGVGVGVGPVPTSRRVPSPRRSTRRSFPTASVPVPPASPSSSSYSRTPRPSHATPLPPSLPPTTPITPTTPPPSHFKPFVNLFLVLAVSTVALCSLSAVLVAGFTLTLYDDCGKRVEDLRRTLGEGQKRVKGSIEGVRTGVGRVVETFGQGAKRLSATTLSSSAGTGGTGQDAGWTSDDTQIPPPHPSRATSPSPSPTRSSHSSTHGGSTNQKMPPRPALRFLIPSVIFALVWTLWKITSDFWGRRKERRRKMEHDDDDSEGDEGETKTRAPIAGPSSSPSS